MDKEADGQAQTVGAIRYFAAAVRDLAGAIRELAKSNGPEELEDDERAGFYLDGTRK